MKAVHFIALAWMCSGQSTGALAAPFSVKEETDRYIFEFGWSAEAAAVPRLGERFRGEMEKAKAGLVAGAKTDNDERSRQDLDPVPHAMQRFYETAGQSERLLSLASNSYGYTGGAHGFSGSGSLLWDRSLARETGIADLLRPGMSWTGAIRGPFCILLDREREERRGEPVRKDELFGDCPRYDDITVVLRDSDGNRRFDHVDVIADQYVAGPYAEGPYDISLPITARMIDRLKPEYRSSFESRPPVR